MSSISRQFGRLTTKGAGNDAKIQVLLEDFEQADKCLAQLVEAVKLWKDAWLAILSGSLAMANEFESLYNPIIGSSDGHSRNEAQTTDEQLRRTAKLKEAYAELQTDLVDEVNMMDDRIMRPANEVREYLKPVKKTIKKREDRRLDLERYQDRVNHSTKKPNKTDRDHQALAKAQEEASKAADNFQVVDEQIRQTLPGLISLCFSLLPHLLAAQIMTQNTLLAQYYTILHTYCGEEGFPSPPPPMEEVISSWETLFKPIQNEIESMRMLARGQAVHRPMQLSEERKKSYTGMNLRGSLPSSNSRRQSLTAPGATTPPGRIARIPSSNTTTTLTRRDDISESGPYTSPSAPAANFANRAPSGPGNDYFTVIPTSRRPSTNSNHSHPSISSPLSTTPGQTSPYTATSPYGAQAAQKKKPPPPPPKPKRIASSQDVYVTAIYSYTAEQSDDLSFEEGDRIKVVKKTDRLDDWWEGEIRGVRGKFPANYCEIVDGGS